MRDNFVYWDALRAVTPSICFRLTPHANAIKMVWLSSFQRDYHELPFEELLIWLASELQLILQSGCQAHQVPSRVNPTQNHHSPYGKSSACFTKDSRKKKKHRYRFPPHSNPQKHSAVSKEAQQSPCTSKAHGAVCPRCTRSRLAGSWEAWSGLLQQKNLCEDMWKITLTR